MKEIFILIYYFSHRESNTIEGMAPTIEFDFNKKHYSEEELPIIKIIPGFIANQNLTSDKRDIKYRILKDTLRKLSISLKNIDGIDYKYFPPPLNLEAIDSETNSKLYPLNPSQLESI